jgi:hypothetical protein
MRPIRPELALNACLKALKSPRAVRSLDRAFQQPPQRRHGIRLRERGRHGEWSGQARAQREPWTARKAPATQLRHNRGRIGHENAVGAPDWQREFPDAGEVTERNDVVHSRSYDSDWVEVETDDVVE